MVSKSHLKHIYSFLLLFCCLWIGQKSAFGQSWPSDVVVGRRCSTALTAPSIYDSLDTTGAPQETYVPDTAAELARYAEDNKTKYHLLLPQIAETELSSVKQIDNNGRVNRGIFEAQFKGQPVIIKATADHLGTKEGFWLTFLNRRGLGVKFLGVTRVANKWGMVLEKIDGVSNKERFLGHDKEIPRAVRQSIRDQIVKLYELGIYPFDVQFVVNSEQAVLMDTEMYQVNNGEWTLQKIISEFEDEFAKFRLDP